MKIAYKEFTSDKGIDDLMDQVNRVVEDDYIFRGLINLDVVTSEIMHDNYLYEIDEIVTTKETIWKAKMLYWRPE